MTTRVLFTAPDHNHALVRVRSFYIPAEKLDALVSELTPCEITMLDSAESSEKWVHKTLVHIVDEVV